MTDFHQVVAMTTEEVVATEMSVDLEEVALVELVEEVVVAVIIEITRAGVRVLVAMVVAVVGTDLGLAGSADLTK